MLNVDQLFVGSGFDMNHNLVRRTSSRDRHDRILHTFELPTAVECDRYVSLSLSWC